jgi:2-dehydropantoate 2-reductase
VRFLVWGAGAIGGTLGAFLARAGHDVTVVDTVAPHVDAINRSGLSITGPVATFTAKIPAYAPAALRGSWDSVILATKAHHTAAGTVGAFVNFGADYMEPGVIFYGGRGTIMVGEAFGARGISSRVTAIRDAWRALDERAAATDNIWGYLWGKEAYGAMLFATALTNDSIADCLASAEHRGLYIALAREILAVARARGVRPEAFDGFDPAAYMPDAPAGAADQSLDGLVAHNRKSAKTHTGIWRDLAVRKRPTEVDAQLGIIVELGKAAGVPVPLTARLVELIHEIERGERPMGGATLHALAA